MLRRALLRSLLAALLLFPAVAPAQETRTRLTFLHTNDNYELLPQRGWGGFAELMTALRAERLARPQAITTFGGDLLSPSIMSSFFKGRQMVELMNGVGVDIAVVGNHEFDFGIQVLQERMQESKFPWLASNVRRNGQPLIGAPDTVLRTVNGVKVGFFGLVTPDTARTSAPGLEVSFTDPVTTAAEMVKRLKAEGAEIIVGLTHLDFAVDREVARKVPGIHLILGGHDHDPVSMLEGSTLIHKSGSDARYLGAVDLDIVRRPPLQGQEAGGKAPAEIVFGWRLIPIFRLAPDPDRAADIKIYTDRLNEDLKIEIGATVQPLDSRRTVLREAESTMGDLITEAMRTATGADIALMNAGSIRGDRVYPAGAKLTRRDIVAELPFGNITVVVELTGADLLETLEHGVSRAEARDGRFLQVAGLRFAYDPRLPPMKRVSEVTVGGDRLDPGKRYKVATNDYLLAGGDGFTMLARGKALIAADDGLLIALQVMSWIDAHKPIDLRPDGRITKK